MNKRRLLYAFLLTFFSISFLHSQVVKAAVYQDPDDTLKEFYSILAEKSGIQIHQVSLLRNEVEEALEAGIIDIAILPDNERTNEVAVIQAPAFGRDYVLISNQGFLINEYNLIDLKTIAVLTKDEPFLNEALIDKYSLEPRIQKARHYDSLVRIMATGRVNAIFIPLEEFHRSLKHLNEERGKFGQPYLLGFKDYFLVLSRRRADELAPLMNRLIQGLEIMKQEGIIEALNQKS